MSPKHRSDLIDRVLNFNSVLDTVDVNDVLNEIKTSAEIRIIESAPKNISIGNEKLQYTRVAYG